MWCLCFLGVIIYWSTSSPSFLLGGITYNNGALTVPFNGVYYIYTHLRVKQSSGYAHPGIGVNGNSKLYLGSYHAHGEGRSKHCALLQQLRKVIVSTLMVEGVSITWTQNKQFLVCLRSSNVDHHFGNICNSIIVFKWFSVSCVSESCQVYKFV